MDRLPSTRLRAACRKTASLTTVRRIVERYGADPEHLRHLLSSADPITRMTALANAAEEDNIEGASARASWVSCDASCEPAPLGLPVRTHELTRSVVEYLLAVGADQAAISRVR